MNKQRLEQIMQILVLPYTNQEFLKKEDDFIKVHRRAFWKLKYKSTYLNRTDSEREYYDSEKRISVFFQNHAEYRAKNLDDIKLLVELFYPEEELAGRMNIYSETGGTDVTSCIDQR